MSPESELEGASEQLRKLNKEFWDTMWMMFKKMSTRKLSRHLLLRHLLWRHNILWNQLQWVIIYDSFFKNKCFLSDTMMIGMKFGKEIKHKAAKVWFSSWNYCSLAPFIALFSLPMRFHCSKFHMKTNHQWQFWYQFWTFVLDEQVNYNYEE